MNKYSIGDKVKIDLTKVDDKHKRYNKTYPITNKRVTSEGVTLYKLKGVPDWGTDEMILEKVE